MQVANQLKRFGLFLIAILTFSIAQISPSQTADDEAQKKIDSDASKTMRVEEENPPVELGLPIPPVAQGYEAIYERFLNGVLLYRPARGNDVGMVTLPIRELSNPLEGTFDLSRCGDTGQYVSISTEYRKEKKPENVSKVEIWLAPRFLIKKELGATASHFKKIMGQWKRRAPVGLFWTWGGWGDMGWYDYLTTENMDNLSKLNLYKNWGKSEDGCGRGWLISSCVTGAFGVFHVSFI